MASRKKETTHDLFAGGSANGTATDTRVWEFPGKLDWSSASTGDLVQFSKIRHWEASSSEPVYLQAVGRILDKGKTPGDERRYVQVEIIWDDAVPRLRPDLRTFLLD